FVRTSFFFLTIPFSLRSSLFPYTSLFRSPSGGRATVRVPPCRGRGQPRPSARSGEFACPSVQTRPGRVTTPLPAWPGPRTGRFVCGAGPVVCRAGPAPGGAAGDAGGGPCPGVGVDAAGVGGGGPA